METRLFAMLLFVVFLVALSTYATSANVESHQGNSLATIGGSIPSATMSVQHQRYAIDTETEPKRAADGELGLQMNRGAPSLSVTGSFTLSAGGSNDKEEENLQL